MERNFFLAWLRSHSTRAFDSTLKLGSLEKKQIFCQHLQSEMALLAWSREKCSEATNLRLLIANVQYISIQARLHGQAVTPGCDTWRMQHLQGASCSSHRLATRGSSSAILGLRILPGSSQGVGILILSRPACSIAPDRQPIEIVRQTSHFQSDRACSLDPQRLVSGLRT